jgi:hypothetical protein
MITNNAEALEGLRMALAQLHDVNVYYAGTDSESQWCTSVALDWTRTALHYGEQAALTDVLARMHASEDACKVCGIPTVSPNGMCSYCQANDDNLRAAKAMGFRPSDHSEQAALSDVLAQGTPTRLPKTWWDNLAALQQAHDAQCGPLCEAHGDPRDTSIALHSATESVTEF